MTSIDFPIKLVRRILTLVKRYEAWRDLLTLNDVGKYLVISGWFTIAIYPKLALFDLLKGRMRVSIYVM